MSLASAKLVLSALSEEPSTPSEIAAKAGLSQKTVQTVLLELVHDSKEVRMKKIGRYRIFWKVHGRSGRKK